MTGGRDPVWVGNQGSGCRTSGRVWPSPRSILRRGRTLLMSSWRGRERARVRQTRQWWAGPSVPVDQ